MTSTLSSGSTIHKLIKLTFIVYSLGKLSGDNYLSSQVILYLNIHRHHVQGMFQTEHNIVKKNVADRHRVRILPPIQDHEQ